jgi:hypothetical protein
VKALLSCALVLAACSTEDNLGNHVFGDVRWSVAVGSPGDERATALAIDTIGNVIVAGTCDGFVDFGATRASCHGSFITQRAYDTGREEWTLVLTNATVASVAIDELGYVIATGSYRGTLDLAGTQLTATGTDPFIAVFDRAGRVEGVAGLGLVGTAATPTGVVEPDGCVYVTGGFHGDMPSPSGLVTNNTGALDGYVAGHFADATGAWTVHFSGEGDQVGRSLALNRERLAVLVHSTGPLSIDNHSVDAPAWPASVLLQFAINGELLWAHALPAASEHVAVARSGAIMVTSRETNALAGECPRLRAFDVAGDELWATPCEDPQRSIDAIAVGAQGTIVTGGRSVNEHGSALFLAAHDAGGAPIGRVSSPVHPYARDSSFDDIAIEPSGEVAFIASLDHPLDLGTGPLPFAGDHDAVIVKLDSPTGRDGPVVLLRE